MPSRLAPTPKRRHPQPPFSPRLPTSVHDAQQLPGFAVKVELEVQAQDMRKGVQRGAPAYVGQECAFAWCGLQVAQQQGSERGAARQGEQGTTRRYEFWEMGIHR